MSLVEKALLLFQLRFLPPTGSLLLWGLDFIAKVILHVLIEFLFVLEGPAFSPLPNWSCEYAVSAFSSSLHLIAYTFTLFYVAQLLMLAIGYSLTSSFKAMRLILLTLQTIPNASNAILQRSSIITISLQLLDLYVTLSFLFWGSSRHLSYVMRCSWWELCLWVALWVIQSHLRLVLKVVILWWKKAEVLWDLSSSA